MACLFVCVHQVVHPGAVVCDGARIGEDCEVGCNTCVGTSVEISQGTRIHFNVSLQNCKVGKGCVIHNGVCIGQDGFGFYVDEKTGTCGPKEKNREQRNQANSTSQRIEEEEEEGKTTIKIGT